MSFIAGIIGRRRGALGPEDILRFEGALDRMRRELLWPIRTTESGRSRLAYGGYPHLWCGPNIESAPKYDAAGQGVQWREIPEADSALDHLVRTVAQCRGDPGNFFDYFHLVVLDKVTNQIVLATDPLGLFPLYYVLDNRLLTFSSHQTFLRLFLRDAFHINWQAVFEYLFIGHNLGDKTLLDEVRILPPDSRLICREDGLQVFPCESFSQEASLNDTTLEEASALILSHLTQKRDHYGAMTNKPFAGFLSGGWDSRLLVSIFADSDRMAMSYTTQQQIRLGHRLVSERKIAQEVAQYVGIRNQFVAPIYRNPKTKATRARILDYSTWFHDWAFTLAERLPRDEYVFCDGILGDILLRGLYFTQDLKECVKRGNREKAVRLLYSQYLRGFNPYTKGILEWNGVFALSVTDEFSRHLMHDLAREITSVPHQDFITFFLLKNRTRRGISPLARFIFGMKGTVIYPFCDPEFFRRALSLPLELRLDTSFYNKLLERARPGLSQMVSTNTKDPNRLEPYLVDSIRDLTWPGQLLARTKSLSPSLYRVLMTGRKTAARKRTRMWAEHVAENTPRAFMGLFTRELRRSIENKDVTKIEPYRFFLEKILMLADFF